MPRIQGFLYPDKLILLMCSNCGGHNIYLSQSKGGIKMGLRAYILINANDDIEQSEFVQILRNLEEMPGIDFVDPVVGNSDIVVMVDAPITVQEIANKISTKKWCKEIQVLRIVSMFERHRSSKKDLMESMIRSGI